MKKFWYFFFGLPNIIGLGIMLFGLIAVGYFIINFALSIVLGILVVSLLYFAGWVVGWWLQDNDANLHFENNLTVEEIERELKQMLKQIKGRVPPQAYTKVEHIAEMIHSVLPQIVESSSTNEDFYTVKRMVFDYLPTTLENYLKLPKAYANMHNIQDGKTAKVLLTEQLTIIDDGLGKIIHSIYNNDAQALMANQRFLEQRLETAGNDFL